MFVIPEGLPLELTPLAFLVGHWRGTGVINYQNDAATSNGDSANGDSAKGNSANGNSGDGQESKLVNLEFSQDVEFWHDGQNYLNYRSSVRSLIGETEIPLPNEVGYWRISKPAEDADAGPGLLPGSGQRAIASHEQLDEFRNAEGGFDLEVSILHPSGISELYFGQILKGRIDLATDAVLRSPNSKPYAAATRLYGLVDGALLWAWDIAALGNPLRSHASARLERIE